MSRKVSEIITQFLSRKKDSSSLSRFDLLEKKDPSLRKKGLKYFKRGAKITPFTELESKDYYEFMKEIFCPKINKEKNITRRKAFNELFKQVECFHQWSDFYTLRLKEVLFVDDYDQFSAKELNDLTIGKECPCPIRTGLINWIEGSSTGLCSCSNIKFPSQQEICENGSVLAKNII